MSGIYGSHPEDMHFQRELNRHLDNSYGQDHFEEDVAAEIAHLTSPRHEFYPFSQKAISEAICEQSDSQWLLFTLYAGAGDGKSNPIIDGMLAEHVREVAKKYWEGCATETAEHNVNARS